MFSCTFLVITASEVEIARCETQRVDTDESDLTRVRGSRGRQIDHRVAACIRTNGEVLHPAEIIGAEIDHVALRVAERRTGVVIEIFDRDLAGSRLEHEAVEACLAAPDVLIAAASVDRVVTSGEVASVGSAVPVDGAVTCAGGDRVETALERAGIGIAVAVDAAVTFVGGDRIETADPSLQPNCCRVCWNPSRRA